MTEQEALILIETLLQSSNQEQPLNDIQSLVLQGSWTGDSYQKIADQTGYEYDYIKQRLNLRIREVSKNLLIYL